METTKRQKEYYQNFHIEVYLDDKTAKRAEMIYYKYGKKAYIDQKKAASNKKV